MIRRSIAAAGAAVVLLAAAPAPGPAPLGAQTALVRSYLDALKGHRFAAAFALLEPAAQAYFRSAGNYASGFNADGFSLLSYAVARARSDANFRLYFVRETLRLHDASNDTRGTTTVIVPYGVVGTGAAARIKDLGRPWRALALSTAHTTHGLTVTVRKISFYRHSIAVAVTFANAGNGFLTVIPYGRSVLRDDTGAVYRPIVNLGFAQTDKRLFLGVHLAMNEQISGVLTFASPVLDDRQRRFALTVAPNVRDGGLLPFALEVAGIGPA